MSLGGQIGNIIAANYKDGSTGNVPFDPSAGIGEFERRQFLPYTQGVVTPQLSAGIGEFERRQFLTDNQLRPTLPPDFMPMPGNDFAPMPNPPSSGRGSADQYSQIMGQMGGGDPYLQIMSQMPTLRNPYAYSPGGAIGGYDPSLYNNAFVGSNSRLNLSGLIGGGGGSDPYSDPNPAWSNMTPAQQAAYYAANPNMAAVTRAGQGLFGLTSLGMAQNYFVPEFVANMSARAMGYDPANLSYGGASRAEQDAMNAALAAQAAESYGGASMAEQDAMNAALGEAAVGSYGGASMAEQQAMNDALGTPGQSVSDSASSAADGYGSGDSAGFGGGTDSGSDGWAKGGKVTKNRLKGPDPKGPDEGYGALLSGEYVIKKSSVKKYGQGLLDMINDGKIPAKKMKSLLG